MAKYTYCGKKHKDEIHNFEDFVDYTLSSKDTFKEEVYEDDCHIPVEVCKTCKRNEGLRYCGLDYPDLGIYKGDHYDDVIESLATMTSTDITVTNSDNSISFEVDSGGIFVVPDTMLEIVINGTSVPTIMVPAFKDETINLIGSWL